MFERLDFLQDHRKRIVDGDHEHTAHDIDDADRYATGRSGHVTAIPGNGGREVGRAQQPRLGANVVDRFLAIPDVVARCHDVEAAVEQLIANLACDAEAGRGILNVGDHEIDLVIVADRRQAAPNQLAAGAADDVADEEEANHESGRSPAIWMVVVRPRRSAIFGSETRSSPLTSVARAWLESHGFVRRATRAKRP